MGSHYCCSECGEYMCLGECLDEQKEEIVVKPSHNNTENMLDKIAIKIENENEFISVRTRIMQISDIRVFPVNITYPCWLKISENDVACYQWCSSKSMKGYSEVTAQEFLTKYKPEPEVDRHELMAMLNESRQALVCVKLDRMFAVYQEKYTGDVIGRMCDIEDYHNNVIRACKSQLDWGV